MIAWTFSGRHEKEFTRWIIVKDGIPMKRKFKIKKSAQQYLKKLRKR